MCCIEFCATYTSKIISPICLGLCHQSRKGICVTSLCPCTSYVCMCVCVRTCTNFLCCTNAQDSVDYQLLPNDEMAVRVPLPSVQGCALDRAVPTFGTPYFDSPCTSDSDCCNLLETSALRPMAPSARLPKPASAESPAVFMPVDTPSFHTPGGVWNEHLDDMPQDSESNARLLLLQSSLGDELGTGDTYAVRLRMHVLRLFAIVFPSTVGTSCNWSCCCGTPVCNFSAVFRSVSWSDQVSPLMILEAKISFDT